MEEGRVRRAGEKIGVEGGEGQKDEEGGLVKGIKGVGAGEGEGEREVGGRKGG